MRIPATITSIARQTPTIKSFDLDLGGRELGFKPGQWVDFFVSLEGAEGVGGYSITSSPSIQDSIGLAIKLDEGDHPVTNWLHKEARVGDSVEISLGGDFYYTPDMIDPIVLIAGGIGLTPLMSIVRAIAESGQPPPTTLIYSVSTPSEILFRHGLGGHLPSQPCVSGLVFTITRLRRRAGMEWSHRQDRRRPVAIRARIPRLPLLHLRSARHDPRRHWNARGARRPRFAHQVRTVVVALYEPSRVG